MMRAPLTNHTKPQSSNEAERKYTAGGLVEVLQKPTSTKSHEKSRQSTKIVQQ
jgi:hypothetical protein